MKHFRFITIFVFTFFIFGTVVFAQGDNIIRNPLGNNVNSLSALFNAIIGVLIQLGTILGALAIMYGGFLYVTSQGNEEQLKKAQVTLTWAVIGIAVLLGARVIFAVIEGTIRQLN